MAREVDNHSSIRHAFCPPDEPVKRAEDTLPGCVGFCQEIYLIRLVGCAIGINEHIMQGICIPHCDRQVSADADDECVAVRESGLSHSITLSIHRTQSSPAAIRADI